MPGPLILASMKGNERTRENNGQLLIVFLGQPINYGPIPGFLRLPMRKEMCSGGGGGREGPSCNYQMPLCQGVADPPTEYKFM